ncbi:acylphosphatase [Fibrobacterota bacterium]
MEIRHVNIKVTGRVQGVFFRASTQQEARNIGIQGFVRNESDGSVYIEAEGPRDRLRKFTEWCGHGPPYAVVKDIQVNEGEVQEYREFCVQY